MKSKQHRTSRGTVSLIVIGATTVGLSLTLVVVVASHLSPLAAILVDALA